MRKILAFMILVIFAALPLGTSGGSYAGSCRSPVAALPGEYPDHPLSPQQSLRAYDTVFYGEVVVPSRKCSIGHCAGLRVLQTVKGQPGLGVLLRVALPKEHVTTACSETPFAAKGTHWVVFANAGTSRGGQRYLDTGEDGPSFLADEMPDFDRLEGQYQMVRARLDQAIGAKLGHF